MHLRLRVEAEGGSPAGARDSVAVGGDATFRIGREPPADLVLPDPTRAVSAAHCEIAQEGRRFVLRDLSTNGTFVNGGETRLREPHLLANGDRIRIGRYTLHAVLEPEAAADPERTVNVPAASAPPRLLVRVRPDAGTPPPPVAAAEILGAGSLVIGRAEESGLVLPDPASRVSRRHCELVFTGRACIFVDHSANGTTRDGSADRIADGTELKTGDRLRLGP